MSEENMSLSISATAEAEVVRGNMNVDLEEEK
jgi:hypothetical protein